jgi:hypothetical protein
VKLPPVERRRGDGFERAIAPQATIRLWAMASGKEVRRIECRKSTVTALVFSPDGKTLASGHADDPFARELQEGKGELRPPTSPEVDSGAGDVPWRRLDGSSPMVVS